MFGVASRPKDINKRAYSSSAIVKELCDSELYPRGLYQCEREILTELSPTIRDKRLLDIGVGGGRTTRALLDISSDYTAIDYSSAMLEVAKSRFPSVSTFFCCDARDMRRFKSASFDFAMFALNGLDYVSHDDRLTILREVHRLLKPGGRFLFSSHNREWEFLPEMRKWPWQRNENPWTRAFWSACLVGLVERPRLKRYEIEENEYAILNVREGNYRLLTTHTTISAQKAQLENVGFKLASLYDNKTGGPVSEPRRFNWIYYLAVKPVVDAEACCSG